MDYSDLRNKTIFDFCDDADVVKKITYTTDKEKHKKECETSPELRWMTLLEYAEDYSDQTLKEHVMIEFSEDIDAFYNE